MLYTTWEWQQLIESASTAQSVVPDSEKHTITFNQDGIYNAKTDCYVLSWGYEVDGNNLPLLGQSRSSCRQKSGIISMPT
jgi:hypothetical protein